MNVSPAYLSQASFALGLHALELRRAADLSQEQLGCILGVDRTSISVIERGRSNLPFDKLVAFSNSFGLSPSEFLAGIALPNPDMQGPAPAALLASRGRPTFYHVTRL